MNYVDIAMKRLVSIDAQNAPFAQLKVANAAHFKSRDCTPLRQAARSRSALVEAGGGSGMDKLQWGILAATRGCSSA